MTSCLQSQIGRDVTCRGVKPRRSMLLWRCPWLSARDRSGLLWMAG